MRLLGGMFLACVLWAGEGPPVDETAVLQAMLKVVKGPGGRPYISFFIDGEWGAGTKAAVAAFQRDRGIVESQVKKDGPTWKALRDLTPKEYQGMRALPGSRIVYLAGRAEDAEKSVREIGGYKEFEAGFQGKVVEVVRRMYAEHGMVMWVTLTGWRRGFGDQAGISRRASWAGPGESTHHYGRACDLGFRDLKWVDAAGKIRTDGDWLERMARALGPASWRFWKARDEIAFSLGLFKIAWEGVHLQDVADERISNARSLVKLLEKTGKMRWAVDTAGREPHYFSDLGRGGMMVKVGTAREIWAGKAPGQGEEVRRLLRDEWLGAERNWRGWEAVE